MSTRRSLRLSESPGLDLRRPFGAGTGLDIVALDPGTSDVTLISGLSTGSPTSQNFSSGGLDPVAAIAVSGSNGFDDLVVANNADGRVALLAGGPQGLTLEQVNDSLDLLSPTGLALASLQNNSLEVYASTAGERSGHPPGVFAGRTGWLFLDRGRPGTHSAPPERILLAVDRDALDPDP